MADKPKNDPLAAAQMPIGGAVLSGESATGDEPMTDVQAAQLRDLCEQKGEPFDGNLTQDQADARIEALEQM